MKKIITINYDVQVIEAILAYNADVVVHCYDNNVVYEIEGRKSPQIICNWNGGSASMPIWEMTQDSLTALLQRASDDSWRNIMASQVA